MAIALECARLVALEHGASVAKGSGQFTAAFANRTDVLMQSTLDIKVLEAPPPMGKLDPVLIASRWICGDLLPEDIPQIAIALSEAGYEDPSVYRVAAESKVDSRNQVERLVRPMFAALGVPSQMSQEGARQIVARQIAREVIAGLRDPWSAATHLDRVVPHWTTSDTAILGVYGILDETEWSPGDGRSLATLEPELIRAFQQLARSRPR